MHLPLRRYWRLLARYLLPRWPLVLLMGLLLAATIGLQLSGPQIQRAFIDAALAGADLRALAASALLFIAVAVATQVVAVLDAYAAERVGWAATNDLRADVALHCLRLDASFHGAHTPGELIERIDGDVTVLAGFFSRFVLYVLGNALLLLGVLVLLGRESLLLGLAAGAFALAVLLAMVRMYARARPIWEAVGQVRARFFGTLAEHLAGAEDLRANGATGYVERRFSERLREWLPLHLRAVLAEQAVWMVALSLFAGAEAVAYGLGLTLVRAGTISAGTVFLMYRYVVLLSRPVGQIQAQIQNLQQAGASISRIEELLATPSRIRDGGRAELPAGALAVELDAVSFAYPRVRALGDRHPPPGAATGTPAPSGAPGTRGTPSTPGAGGTAGPGGTPGPSGTIGAAHGDPTEGAPLEHAGALALDGVSLSLAPGRVLGLLGRTGSGKSTLARLLVRAYDVSSGTVRVGGVDVRAAPLAHLRRRVGMVTQGVQLLRASVRDNLTLFDPAVPDARLLDAIDALGLSPWLASLPRGLGTELAPGGGDLSAGQAQLLAFVRAFLGDAGLVVLDEASSRLDPATEEFVEGAVDRLLRGRSAVVIAHRLETLRRADEIAVLDAGRLVEWGPRARLAADPGSRLFALLRAGATGATGHAAEKELLS